jgi:tripartite-type tricarboxylate transporter receptor subunit TctC
MVLRSPADGYTLFMAASANVINTQNDKVSIVRESAPIAMIGQEPIILSINPSLPVKTLDLLPNLPSFIRRVCSGYALVWGVLRTQSV